jgi:enoyl-CoA hydratase/carnithine racemase
MLTHCDFVYAAESTRFQIPFINLALTPEFGSSYSIPARVGHLRAAELFMLGEPFTAAHAAELGLVTKVVADSDVLATARATAAKLAAKPAGALSTHKRLLKRAAFAPLRDAVAAESTEFIERVRSAEAKEAFSAFFEKRAPNFQKAA